MDTVKDRPPWWRRWGRANGPRLEEIECPVCHRRIVLAANRPVPRIQMCCVPLEVSLVRGKNGRYDVTIRALPATVR